MSGLWATQASAKVVSTGYWMGVYYYEESEDEEVFDGTSNVEHNQFGNWTNQIPCSVVTQTFMKFHVNSTPLNRNGKYGPGVRWNCTLANGCVIGETNGEDNWVIQVWGHNGNKYSKTGTDVCAVANSKVNYQILFDGKYLDYTQFFQIGRWVE